MLKLYMVQWIGYRLLYLRFTKNFVYYTMHTFNVLCTMHKMYIAQFQTVFHCLSFSLYSVYKALKCNAHEIYVLVISTQCMHNTVYISLYVYCTMMFVNELYKHVHCTRFLYIKLRCRQLTHFIV